MEKISSKLMMKSLDTWAKNNKDYKDLYKNIPRETLKIAFLFFHECPNITHFNYQIWWAKEHNRFVRNKEIKQVHLSILHEILIKFTTELLNGKINTKEKD